MKQKGWVLVLVVIALSTVVFGITGVIVNTIMQASQVNSGLYCDQSGNKFFNLSSCANGEVLRYNSTALSWKCGNASFNKSGLVIGGGFDRDDDGTPCTYWGNSSCGAGESPTCPSGSTNRQTGAGNGTSYYWMCLLN